MKFINLNGKTLIATLIIFLSTTLVAQTKVPNVLGKSPSQAKKILKSAGVKKIKFVDKSTDLEKHPQGKCPNLIELNRQVVKTDPASNSVKPILNEVTVYFERHFDVIIEGWCEPWSGIPQSDIGIGNRNFPSTNLSAPIECCI